MPQPNNVPAVNPDSNTLNDLSSLHKQQVSLRDILVSNPRTRLYVHPLIWTPHHLTLLHISTSRRELLQHHRTLCPVCAQCGTVSDVEVQRARTFSSHDAKDEALAELIRSSVRSFEKGLERRLFRILPYVI
jgi:hypothetical protein